MGAHNVRAVRPWERPLLDARLLRQVQALGLSLPRLSNDSVPSLGLEIEGHLVFHDGRPAHGIAAKVLELLNDPRVKTELGDWQIEINLTGRAIIGHPLWEMYREAEDLIRRINELAEQFGAQLVFIGTLPTLTLQDVQSEYLAPVDRYPLLDSTLWQDHQPTTLHLPGGVNLTVDSVRTEMVCTSIQPHVYVPGLGSLVPTHNLLVASAGPIMASLANAPYAFGSTGGHDIRTMIFGAATNQRCWVNGYVNDPLEPFRRSLEFPSILTRTDREFSLWRARRGVVPMLDALSIQMGTTWPMIERVVADMAQLHLRHEIRYLSAGPTLADMFAALALIAGLALNPQSRDLYEGHSSEDAISNFEQACLLGPDAQLLWPGRYGTTPGERMAHLLHLAIGGLVQWGVMRDEAEHFLAPIQAHANGATGGSVWQQTAVAAYQAAGHNPAAAVNHMFAQYMVNACGGLGASVTTWPVPDPQPVHVPRTTPVSQ